MGEVVQPTLRVEYEQTAQEHLITLIGEMDMANVDEVRAPVMRSMDSADGKPVIVDMSELSFIDSSGIRLLLEAQAASNADSNRLSIRGVGEGVSQVLRMTGLDERLNLID